MTPLALLREIGVSYIISVEDYIKVYSKNSSKPQLQRSGSENFTYNLDIDLDDFGGKKYKLFYFLDGFRVQEYQEKIILNLDSELLPGERNATIRITSNFELDFISAQLLVIFEPPTDEYLISSETIDF